MQITISLRIQVGSNTERESQIHVRCSQADVFFIDHYSGYMRIKNQVDINATETVKA